MRALILSDVHHDLAAFDPALVRPSEPVDVVLAAGDIAQGRAGVRWLAEAFPSTPVLYVLGNHEFYGWGIENAWAGIRHGASNTTVQVMVRMWAGVRGVRILGCTLWTDYRLQGDSMQTLAMQTAAEGLNDHRLIRDFTPRHALTRHQIERAWLERELAEPYRGPTVVLTHHAPHPLGSPPQYRGNALDPAFCSDLSEMILRYQPAVWVFGHTHHRADFRVGGTRLVTNAVGYPGEREGWEPKVIEL